MYMKKLTGQVTCTYDDPVTETKYGKLRGLKIDSTYIFRGIRYAQARRFHAPTEPTPWEGIKEAYQYGYVCSELNTPVPHDQFTVPHFFYPQNEHCQYLNVWTQSLDPERKRPVMIWLHGGGWFSGSSVELLSYDGENLSAADDVVVVSVNHRLNILGYLDLSEYGEEYEDSANVGLMDLVAALKWVHENIRAFGGDPENVTIFGQSGGGAKVLSLMQTPAADGLFHRAIMQSGGMGASGKEAVSEQRKNCRHAAALILKYLHISPENVREIETADWYDLAQAAMNAIYEMSQEGKRVSWSPIPDGKYYLGHPLDFGFRKETISIPLMIGTVLGEFSGNFDKQIGDRIKNKWDEETINRYMDDEFGEKKELMKSLFNKAYPDRNPADVFFIDTGMRSQAISFARARAAAGGPTWNWMFNLESPFNYGTVPWHNAEECYVFRNSAYIEAQYIPDVSEHLEDQMAGAWVQFAKTGDPNFGLIPAWPKVTADSCPTMCFDRITDLRTDHDKELMENYPAPKKKGFPGSGKMYAIFGIKPEE